MKANKKKQATPSRHQLKWGIPDLQRLTREYELLELDVGEIASLHQRSEPAILNMLQKEGFIEEWGQARGYTSTSNYVV